MANTKRFMVINTGNEEDDILVDLANTTIKELQDLQMKYPFSKVSYHTISTDEIKGVM